MRYIDAPIQPLASRTPREIAFLGIVIACSAFTFGHWPEFFTTAGVGLIFALRLPQARPIAVGFCLGWLVSMTALTRALGVDVVNLLSHWQLANLRFILPAAALALLTSRDLFERFDAAPARWLPNVWRELPTRHWRAMRWCAYSLGILVALVIPGWLWIASRMGLSAALPTWITVGVVLSLALLVLGRATGFLVATGTAALVLARLTPLLLSNDNAPTPYWGYGADWPLGVWPAMILPICLAAAAVLVFALPYCVRIFVRR